MVSYVDPSNKGSFHTALYSQFLGSPKRVFDVMRDALSPNKKYTPADLSKKQIIKINVMAAAYFLYHLIAIASMSKAEAGHLHEDITKELNSRAVVHTPPHTERME